MQSLQGSSKRIFLLVEKVLWGKERVCAFFYYYYYYSFSLLTGFLAREDMQLGQSYCRHEVMHIRTKAAWRRWLGERIRRVGSMMTFHSLQVNSGLWHQGEASILLDCTTVVKVPPSNPPYSPLTLDISYRLPTRANLGKERDICWEPLPTPFFYVYFL